MLVFAWLTPLTLNYRHLREHHQNYGWSDPVRWDSSICNVIFTTTELDWSHLTNILSNTHFQSGDSHPTHTLSIFFIECFLKIQQGAHGRIVQAAGPAIYSKHNNCNCTPIQTVVVKLVNSHEGLCKVKNISKKTG